MHNHPSGDPTPSKADIAVTKDIVKAAKPLGVTVHDHLIIGRGRHTSLRDMGRARLTDRVGTVLRRYRPETLDPSVAAARKTAAARLLVSRAMCFVASIAERGAAWPANAR